MDERQTHITCRENLGIEFTYWDIKGKVKRKREGGEEKKKWGERQESLLPCE